MDKNAALGAGAGIALTVAGGVSALFLTIGQPGASPSTDTDVATTDSAVAIEYVDQNGNPIAAPMATDPVVPEVVVVNPGDLAVDPAPAAATSADAVSTAYSMESEYPEGEEYPESEEEEAEEYPEGEGEEEHDDYEDGDEDEEYEDD